MKKLMIAAAAAAMVGGAYAKSACTPEPVCPVDVARVYQVQMNVYTTKGVVQPSVAISIGSACVPGETKCLVKRGKDKTVLRGYVYFCSNACELKDYSAVFADVRRRAFFEDAEFAWDFLNIMGVRNTDAECAWTFEGTVAYDKERQQEYALRGAGYGTFNTSAFGFNNMSGYFAGTASASYDLKSKLIPVAEDAEDTTPCNCQPSQVLFCDTFGKLDYDDENTVAFGAWKMKYNQNVTDAYLKQGVAVFPSLLGKLFK